MLHPRRSDREPLVLERATLDDGRHGLLGVGLVLLRQRNGEYVRERQYGFRHFVGLMGINVSVKRLTDFSDAGSTTQINGYTFDVHEIVSEGQESRRIFTAEIQGEDRKRFVKITLPITLPIVSGDEFQAVVDSLAFNPSVETRATAQVIR